MKKSRRPTLAMGPSSARSKQQSSNRSQQQVTLSIPKRICTKRTTPYIRECDLVLSSLTGVTNPYVVSNGTQGTLSMAFTLSFIPFSTYSGVFNNTDHTQLTALFDLFQLEFVTFTFIPNFTLVSDILPATSANQITQCTAVADFTDTAAPTSYFAIQGYGQQQKVTSNTNKQFSITIRPTILRLLQLPSGTSATAQYEVADFPVMPTASVTSTAGVQIYGLKFAVNPYQTNQPVGTNLMYWTVNCRSRARYFNQK